MLTTYVVSDHEYLHLGFTQIRDLDPVLGDLRKA
jgi:hypothetical protein